MRGELARAPVQFAQRAMKPKFSSRSASEGGTDYARVVSADRLTSINIDSSGAAVPEGRVLFSQDLNPRAFTNTNLEVEAALWDRYRLKKVTFTYCPNVGTSTAGSLVGGFDPDVQDEGGYAVGSDVPIRKFCAHPTAAQTSLYTNMSWTYRAPKDLPFLYAKDAATDAVGAISHWTSPGKFVLLTNMIFGMGAGTAAGVLWYDAVYEFNGRNVEGAIQDFAALSGTSTGSGAATPFAAGTIAYRAGDINDTIGLPTFTGNAQLEWQDLEPTKAYMVRAYFGGGTTCSASGTMTAVATFGTTIYSIGSFSATETAVIGLFTPTAGGRLRLTCNQGTWVAYPTTFSFLISSMPSSTVNILIT